MIRSICVWLVQFCVRHITSWPWPRLLSGLGCGFILLGLQQQYLAQLGSSRPVTAAAWIVIGLAWSLAWGLRPAASVGDNKARFAGKLAVPGVLVGLCLVIPWCWGLHEVLLNDAILTSRSGLFVYSALWAVVTVGCAVWCVGRLSLMLIAETGASSQFTVRPSAAFLFGISSGLGLGLAATWGSLYVTAIAGCAILLGAQVWQLLLTRKIASSSTASISASSQFASNIGPWSAASSSIIAVTCGGLGLWTIQVLELLLPATIFTLSATVSGLLFGMAIGCRLTQRNAVPRLGLSACAHAWTVLTLLGMSAGFSMVVFRLVTLTGSVSQVWMLHSIRWLLVGCCLAPLGLIWTWAVSRLESAPQARPGSGRLPAWCSGVLLALIGGMVTDGILVPKCGLNLTCYAWLWVLASAKLVDVLRTGELPRNTLVRGFALASLCVLAIAPTMSRGVRPELAARLLFATNVFLADQGGTPQRELPFLDEGRLETQLASEHGTYTVWKSAVARHQIRENGIPRGNLSTNTEFSPQDTGEVLLSLLPLTLHEAPRRIAILGLGSSVPLQAGLASPVLEVNTVETDPQLVSLLKQVTRNTDAGAIWQDERLTVTTADPALWVVGSNDQYDVVISNPSQSALVQSSALYTQEFYRRAARRLTADGIFCQRFQFVDYGPRPLQTMAATLRSVFRHVMAVETGSGEVAWLATNAESGLIRQNVVDRMQAPHVRELMAQVGWDWSVLLTLAAYDDSGLEKVLEKVSPGLNTASNGRFCALLPGELMRWAAKSEEIQKSLTVHASKILSWVGDAGTDEDLLRRLAEVRGQQELVAKFPDQYWGYRSQVRKQISTRPMSRIQQAKHEEHKADKSAGLHPDDKRRLRYFQQLSKAIHGQQADDVVQLAAFAAPYDPLVSLFMHQEVAEIAAQVPSLPPGFELTHRLHMIYYSPSFDTSVRNPLTVLRLVLEKPECVASNAARWDVINGMLEILQIRWEQRGNLPSSNARMVARDVEENIVLVERTLEELPKLRADVGLSAEDWDARKRSIERNLLRPLRGYRERLQPMAAKQRFDTAEAQQDGTLPSAEDLQFPGANAVAN
ncbi:MAG: speE 2 [Planctomycetaceae bacterium]|nr:speE 2 [Planctomycetaceae bacterium]